MPSVYRILIADPIHEQARNLLTSRPGFEVAIATGLNETELAERIGTYDGIIVRSKDAPNRARSRRRSKAKGHRPCRHWG